MCRHSWLAVRRLVSAAAPLLMFGLMAQAANAQTLVGAPGTPGKTVIRPQTTPEQNRGGPSIASPPPNKNACSCSTGIFCDGACCAYPTSKTIGQLNYVIYNQCKAIPDLHLRFEVTKELTAEHDNAIKDCNPSDVNSSNKLPTTGGIFVQFNAFSKDAPNALIQYIFAVTGTKITPHIQYSGGTPDKVDHDWQENYANAYGLTLAKPNSLAKGFVLEVALDTDDKGYVNGASFTVTEPDGKKHVQKAPKAGLFPLRISEFQTNIVSTNANYVDLAKDGAGTLSYSSKDKLSVEGGNYEHCAAAAGTYDGGTCEASNASYGGLNPCSAATTLTQSVTVK
jgi:hypothetical protein